MAQRVSVFGLGYVGCVSAACFAREGHSVIGVDVAQAKVDMLNDGKATIVEHGIAELVAQVRTDGRMRATTDVSDAVQNSDVSLICVGTPSKPNGSLELTYVERVCAQIGAALRDKASRHTVVVRSTVLPGSTHEVAIPALEHSSGKKAGGDFGVCMNPEFLREGSSIKDFFEPPFTLIGCDDADDAAPVAQLYASITAPLHITATRVAEMIKYACNSFHGLKVGFANEIGSICKALGIDSHEVMRLFCEDTKLNISAAYLRPGFAFGGSCLPKDLRAITYRARQLDVSTPILSATLESNDEQIERAFEMIMALGKKRVGILGLAFKAGTDDLRESPNVTLIERLIGKGVKVAIYDREVTQAQIIGANREYIEREIPHIWSLMRPSIDAVLQESEVIVIGNGSAEFRDPAKVLGDGRTVIDLVRVFGTKRTDGANYQGISW
ncbi:MAG TPA: UDP-glucose/GDP-mannose dehydrogenase family protein [Gemmatimonadaceae bacterium]|nr:UDP-glucose/GDP-mannose dehydrogenase family protein [Gemmatimonadaceae bacterium]